ncbi:MAG: hypothetical protein K0R54_2797 [Clostridiaceae bacterium]|nr:hypothetical protein [Clostridiaceae bacterium]
MSKHSKKYNYYFGIPHAHTCYSTGHGTPTDAYEYARGKKLDFLIVTDHCSRLNKSMGKEHITRWDKVIKESEDINKSHKRFLALAGFEISIKRCGDFNVINTQEIINRKINNINEFYSWLKDKKGALVLINHPDDSIENFENNDSLRQVVNLIEVGNGCAPYKYTRKDKYYFNLLDKGWRIGAINGQDNHLKNWGDSDNLTAIVSYSLKNRDIIEALKSMRTYSTESRTLKLSFKCNDKWMGSTLNVHSEQLLNIEIKASDRINGINELQIISCNNEIVKSYKCRGEHKVKWNIDLQNDNSKNWYVVKVIEDNSKQAISSPIFIN